MKETIIYGEDNGFDKPFNVLIYDDVYEVYLPHKCDEWVIAQGNLEEVRERLKEFLNDGMTALNALTEISLGLN